MWIITKDLTEPVEKGKTAVGTCSVDFTIEKMKKAQRKKTWYPFRLKDGDDNVYYEGFSTTNDDEGAFAPLDDFGHPDSGCCMIEYKTPRGIWEPL